VTAHQEVGADVDPQVREGSYCMADHTGELDASSQAFVTQPDAPYDILTGR